MVSHQRFEEGEGENYAEDALEWYELYHRETEGDIAVLYRLVELCKSSTCDSQFWVDELTDSLRNRNPVFSVEQTVGTNVLSGIDVDLAQLSRGEPTDVWLFWEGTIHQEPDMLNRNFFVLPEQTVQVENRCDLGCFQQIGSAGDNGDVSLLPQSTPSYRIHGKRGEFSVQRFSKSEFTDEVPNHRIRVSYLGYEDQDRTGSSVWPGVVGWKERRRDWG